MFQMILVPWDASELCVLAMDTALELAKGYEAEIVALSVITPEGATEADMIASFDPAREAAEAAGVTLSHDIVRGADASHVLHEHAHEHGFDIVVIGHHRDHRPGTLVLHGVTEHLVSESDVPLLVIPGPPRPDKVSS